MAISIKDYAKTILAKNAKVNEFVYDHADLTRHAKYINLLSELSNLDYLDSVDPLKEYMKAVKNNKLPFYSTNANWSNAHIYGIYHSLFGQQNSLISTPSVEHGLILHNAIFTDTKFTSRPACVSMSSFRKKIIRSYSNRPVFSVGPYIDYAKYYYNNDRLRELKNSLGKTLLVFPSHSTDNCELSFDQKKFLDYLEKYIVGFDTILINSFYWNINDLLISALESEGFKIVSCGLRDDIHFLERLKSYIYLSDVVIGDSIGTHVGYVLSMNKPYIYMDSDIKEEYSDPKEREDLPFVNYHLNKIRDCFIESPMITPEQKEVCGSYWGFDCHKTQDELNSILEISADIFEYTQGKERTINQAVNYLLNKYIVEDTVKYDLLFDAL